jgi:ribA/ribD-fused uncharacterized protein
MINSFSGRYAFLSNFYPAEVEYCDILYPTSEHAYQAAKTRNRAERLMISRLPTPGKAKRAEVALRQEWEEIKDQVMLDILRLKFTPGTRLANMLLDTGPEMLVEGNTDTYWGRVQQPDGSWKGRNQLGKLLMRVRKELGGEMPELTQIILATDGAATPQMDPCPAGWGAVLQHMEKGQVLHEKELSGSWWGGTSNSAELEAVLQGLSALKQQSEVTIILDSKNALGWLDLGWKCRYRHNRERVEAIINLCQERGHVVHYHHVKGHNGHSLNEQADELAGKAKQALIEEGYDD